PVIRASYARSVSNGLFGSLQESILKTHLDCLTGIPKILSGEAEFTALDKANLIWIIRRDKVDLYCKYLKSIRFTRPGFPIYYQIRGFIQPPDFFMSFSFYS
ncbi:MAG: hypothetical protein K8H85_13090, partial [Cyclobacteriaceae bacterium]|nr:hypothetical protein [Cyclobacteriaceae bacterium]